MGKKMRLDQILSLDDLMVQEATVIDKPIRLTGVWERKHGKRARCKRFTKTDFFSKLRFSGIGGKEQQRLHQEIVSQLDCLMEEEPANREPVLRAVLGLDRHPSKGGLRVDMGGDALEKIVAVRAPEVSFFSRLTVGDAGKYFKFLRQDRPLPDDGPEFCI